MPDISSASFPLAATQPDVLFFIYNDHVTSFFLDHYSHFALGIDNPLPLDLLNPVELATMSSNARDSRGASVNCSCGAGDGHVPMKHRYVAVTSRLPA